MGQVLFGDDKNYDDLALKWESLEEGDKKIFAQAVEASGLIEIQEPEPAE